MGKEEDGAFTVHCVYIQKFSKIFEDCWARYSVELQILLVPVD